MDFLRYQRRITLPKGRWIAGSLAQLVPDMKVPAMLCDRAMVMSNNGWVIGVIARSYDTPPFSCVLHADHVDNPGGVALASLGDLTVETGITPAVRSPHGVWHDQAQCDYITIMQNGQVLLRLS